jgi:hypothetical protein
MMKIAGTPRYLRDTSMTQRLGGEMGRVNRELAALRAAHLTIR